MASCLGAWRRPLPGGDVWDELQGGRKGQACGCAGDGAEVQSRSSSCKGLDAGMNSRSWRNPETSRGRGFWEEQRLERQCKPVGRSAEGSDPEETVRPGVSGLLQGPVGREQWAVGGRSPGGSWQG